MEFFTKKIFDGKIDDSVHLQFQKFSRGEFGNRAMVRIKKSTGKYTISTTSEYAKELIMTMAEKLGDKKTQVNGAIISALDLQGFKYEERKMAMGVRKYMINREMSGNEILSMCNSVQRAFFGLSFNVGEEELKIKDKSPKSAKGSGSSKKEDADLKIDFCKLKTNDKKLVEELIFDSEAGNFKKVEIKYDFIIKDIVIPGELKNEKDFAKVREGAHRKGIIIKQIDVDGKKVKKEVDFEA
jgi:hypothetical protein